MMTLKQRLYKLQFTIEFWRQEFSKLSSRGLSDVIEYMFNDYAYAAMRERDKVFKSIRYNNPGIYEYRKGK